MDRNQQAKDFLRRKTEMVKGQTVELNEMIAQQATLAKRKELNTMVNIELDAAIQKLAFRIENQRNSIEQIKNAQMPEPSEAQKVDPNVKAPN